MTSANGPLYITVTAIDPRDGLRHMYGRATDSTGAEALVASCKVQNVRYREILIELGDKHAEDPNGPTA